MDYWEGWINEVTFHAVMVILNDRYLVDRLDTQLKRNEIKIPSSWQMEIKPMLPDHLKSQSSNIDIWSIYMDRLRYLAIELGAINQEQYEAVHRSLNKDTSYCKKLRLALLREIDQSIDDPFHVFNETKKDLVEEVEETVPMKCETKHFVNGKEANNYDATSQAELISSVQKEIDKLEGIKTPTKAIKAKIAELKAFLKDAVATFDKVESPEE